MKRFNIVVSLALLLTGCEAHMFGMPESQFRSLNPAQQQQVIAAYNQRQMVRTQNEPIESLIGVAGQAVQQMNNRNNNPGPAMPAPGRPDFPGMPPRPSFTPPEMPHYDFKPGECHMEGNTQVCHHEESSHSSSSSSGIRFR